MITHDTSMNRVETSEHIDAHLRVLFIGVICECLPNSTGSWSFFSFGVYRADHPLKQYIYEGKKIERRWERLIKKPAVFSIFLSYIGAAN